MHQRGCFSLVLLLARVRVTPGSMRGYLSPTEVAHVVQLFHDGTSIHSIARSFAVSPPSQWHGRDFRRQVVTLGELIRTVEDP